MVKIEGIVNMDKHCCNNESSTFDKLGIAYWQAICVVSNIFGLVCLKVDDSSFQQCLSVLTMPYVFTLQMPLYHQRFQRFDYSLPG